MKRLWFGVALLAALLVTSLYLGRWLEHLHRPVYQDLDKAAVAALEENWPLASALYLRAQERWSSCRNLTAALARHDPVEEIDSGFAVLPAYAAGEDTVSFCASCGELAQLIRALAFPHGPNWWNIL